jgi:hypothetical protein
MRKILDTSFIVGFVGSETLTGDLKIFPSAA